MLDLKEQDRTVLNHIKSSSLKKKKSLNQIHVLNFEESIYKNNVSSIVQIL